MIPIVSTADRLFVRLGNALQPILLLAIRLYWGWQFAVTGWGKLQHLGPTAAYFASLQVPYPLLTTGIVASIEFVGGIFLILGFASRVTGLSLAVIMLVAYQLTARSALESVISNPGRFYSADPFTFLFASLIVLAFGAGLISLDRLIFKN